MDLMNFDPGQGLYFEEDLPVEVTNCLDQASALGAAPAAESPLLLARETAPDSYTVLVALYRYYYFTHRFADALQIGDAAIARAARDLNWPVDWRDLTPALLQDSGSERVPTVRFWLFALKGTGYLALRLGDADQARDRLGLLCALDPADQMGGAALMTFLPSPLSRQEM